MYIDSTICKAVEFKKICLHCICNVFIEVFAISTGLVGMVLNPRHKERVDNLETANQELDRLRKNLDKIQSELTEAHQEAEVCLFILNLILLVTDVSSNYPSKCSYFAHLLMICLYRYQNEDAIGHFQKEIKSY